MPAEPLTPQEMIRENADKVVRGVLSMQGVELKYDAESVRWLDDFIEAGREGLAPDHIMALVNLYGSFLGECIRLNYGGEWVYVQETWGIQFNEGNVAFPFNKVRKQLENGRAQGDGISSFYTLIPGIYRL